ncbi:hypothetical protein VB620_11170 [Nodularia harveyana UHCC-0300]|uniref:RiboL-PSP-HEPN domain-containing protein n=1 Tax=Nodularia harveyana UHCC-0300 TaxID=2974287 RepID=A0ABU5UF23_9CYAN|nr:hypothetical protein [Nodularia harveyana]MEA5581898.1 hypothetical protein [Nodularia harveyana UHCC-0300]
MDEQTPEHISRMDWRINNLTWTTAPFTPPGSSTPVPPGTAVTEAAIIYHGKEDIGISIPNATALLLNLSQISHLQAEQLISKCLSNKDEFSHLPDSDVFAFYEQMMASIVFAYTSLESFVNEELPDEYIHIVVDKKKSPKNYNKEQIERHLSLDIKLRDVLPAVLKIKSLKDDKTIWEDFQKLQSIRHRIIHMKTSDRNYRGGDKDSIWNVILSKPLIKTYATAKNIMYYFLKSKNKIPRWFDKCDF